MAARLCVLYSLSEVWFVFGHLSNVVCSNGFPQGYVLRDDYEILYRERMENKISPWKRSQSRPSLEDTGKIGIQLPRAYKASRAARP